MNYETIFLLMTMGAGIWLMLVVRFLNRDVRMATWRGERDIPEGVDPRRYMAYLDITVYGIGVLALALTVVPLLIMGGLI